METSVRVGIRVRPMSTSEVNEGCSSCLSYPTEENQIIIGNDKLFGFDFVFNELHSQDFVYKKSVLPMIENLLKGYNVTLLAYGQTGSGKTYTMGTCADENIQVSSIGIIPRMVEEIFRKMPDSEYEYTIRVSFLEIYKEDIHDLLAEDVSVPLNIREENQSIKIPGLTETLVNNTEDVLTLLKSGALKRSVGGTAMNAQSSRSHAIFTLNFVLRPKVEMQSCYSEHSEELPKTEQPVLLNETLTAKLHLVDLAGSERLKRTQSEGDRLKEGININRGLLALGNVISALCERDIKKRSHIPYRDSRLTRLLQDSLGGNSTTLMLACVSPADVNMEETLNTLRYADRARLIKNKPILNRADPKDAELAKLRALVSQLQARLTSNTSLPLLSPCPKIVKSGPSNTGSHFSTEVITGLIDKNKKLETEKRSLCEELDRTIEETNELYKKIFDKDILLEMIFAEIGKIESILIALKLLVDSESTESSQLKVHTCELSKLLSEIKKMKHSVDTDVMNAKIEEAYKNYQSEDNFEDKEDLLKESDKVHVTEAITLVDANEEQKLERSGSELRARRMACKERMELIEATIRQKNDLLVSLEAAGEKGDECYTTLLKQYESQIRELESRILDLETQKNKLMMEEKSISSKDPNNTNRETRLISMEKELSQARRQLSELSRLKKAKEARETECVRLRDEIQLLKVSMVRTAKQLKEESNAYRRWRTEKDLEVRRLQEHDRRLQCEMSRMVSVHERQQAVLKRRVEAAAAAEKRLKELLLRQKEFRNDREKRQTEIINVKNAKSDLASRVRTWVCTDLDVQVSMGEARYHLSRLMESRKMLCDQLRAAETKLTVAQQNGEACDNIESELETLSESIQLQTQQISDLQQKLMDAGERSVDQNSSAGSVDHMLSSRLAQLHNIQEARIALKYLFKRATESLVTQHTLETQITDVETQLNAQKEETQTLQQSVVDYSNQLSKSEELRKKLSVSVETNTNLIKCLQDRVYELESSLQEAKKQVVNVNSLSLQTNILDNRDQNHGSPDTPVYRQKLNTTYIHESNTHSHPTLLVPDSTGKRSHFDRSGESEPETKKKLSNPTWSLPFTQDDEEIDHSEESPIETDPIRITRCRCRGACSSRCSCKRSGNSCVSNLCQCVSGVCTNRNIADIKEDENIESIAGVNLVMKPPSGLPPQKPKRRGRTLQLNHTANEPSIPVVTNSESNILNTTFDLTNQKSSNFDEEESPILSKDITGKGLWPKYRLSYFPSPSLRSDV